MAGVSRGQERRETATADLGMPRALATCSR